MSTAEIEQAADLLGQQVRALSAALLQAVALLIELGATQEQVEPIVQALREVPKPNA